LRSVQTIQTLLEDRVLPVPETEGEAEPLVVVPGLSAKSRHLSDLLNSRDTGHTILTPSICPARSHLERETVPRITIRRVIFTDGTLSISRYPFQLSSRDSPIVAQTRKVPIASSVPHSHQTGPACAPRPTGIAARGFAAGVPGETALSAPTCFVVQCTLSSLCSPRQGQGYQSRFHQCEDEASPGSPAQ
jgi:hypothetical protein